MTNSLKALPNNKGYFGKYGGQIIPPELKPIFDDINKAYDKIKEDPEFRQEYGDLLKYYVGRPSPLYFAQRLTEKLGGAKVYLKREDLNHTGAHKINHTLGEALLARKMGKKKLIAETGAGQHGVALATAAAIVGMECEIHMGEVDVRKQHANVVRMKFLGAKVVTVTSGGRCLKEAVDSAFGEFVKDPENIFFGIGSVVGPHPFPRLVRDFQSVIGRETREQIMDREGTVPDYLVACVGGGSNAIGLFHEFLEEKEVRMIGVEPSGKGFRPGEHAATLTLGSPGEIHGMFTYLLQDNKGEPLPVYSIASGLDYPGVGPVHAHLKDESKVEYETASDVEALEAFQILSKTEGILPALESAHALAHVVKMAPQLPSDNVIVVNLSGRGDKDVDHVMEQLEL